MKTELDFNDGKFDQHAITEARVIEIIKEYFKYQAFSEPKVTDTPRSSYHVVSRGYVNLHGASTSRPTSSVIGQFYLDTTINKPIWWNGTNFQDSQGNVV